METFLIHRYGDLLAAAYLPDFDLDVSFAAGFSGSFNGPLNPQADNRMVRPSIAISSRILSGEARDRLFVGQKCKLTRAAARHPVITPAP
jgi:hypothetical protein